MQRRKGTVMKNILQVLVIMFVTAAFAGCSSNRDRNADNASDASELITENSSDINLGTDSDTDDETENGIMHDIRMSK